MTQCSFLKTLLLLSLAFHGSSAGETEIGIYSGQVDVDLCGDTPDVDGLSFAFKTAIEDSIAGFYQDLYPNGTFQVLSVTIDESQFVEASECPDSEEEQNRRKLRGSTHSNLYYIIGGQCYGACPDDPSDGIDTLNRFLRKKKDSVFSSDTSKNEALTQRMKQAFTEITHAEFKVSGSRIDCSSNKNCNSNNAICCGVGDCLCANNDLVLCDPFGSNCKNTEYPSCLDDSTCDNSISMTRDRQTLVIGSGFLEENSSVQVYDVQADGKWNQRGTDIHYHSPNKFEEDTNTHNHKKRGGGFGSSVSISNDGDKLVVGAHRANRVSIYHWNSEANLWYKTHDLNRSERSMFGLSLQLSGSGRRLVVGAPVYRSDTGDKAGALFMYRFSDFSDTWELYGNNNPIISNTDNRLGWTVAIESSSIYNIITATYRFSPKVKSFYYNEDTDRWEKVK